MEIYYQPSKIYFECDSLNQLPNILKKYGKKIFIVTTPDEPLVPLYNRVKALCEDNGLKYLHFDQVTPNPSSTMIEAGHEMLNAYHADVVLAVGGGSSIDTAKVLALTNQAETIDWDMLFEKFDSPYGDYGVYSENVLPIISVPTTSGTGSQVTQAAVISRNHDKCTIYHPQCISREVILDPNLVATLPLKMSMATGFDAFTHAFESYLNVHHSVYSRFDSVNAIKMICEYLPKLHGDITNIEYRKYMSLSDTLAGKALSNSGADIPHPLSEIIGGTTNMTHGVALACVFVPFVNVMNDKHKEDFAKLADIIDPSKSNHEASELTDIVADFMESIGMNVSLKTMGVTQNQFDEICSSPILHHLPFASYEECIKILEQSYE